MDNNRSATSYKLVVSTLLLAASFSIGPAASAQQQPKLTRSYAKAALASLHAIESDLSDLQEKARQSEEADTTQAKLDAAYAEVMTEQEESMTATLRQVYRLKIQDNDLLRAYGKVSEVERAQDPSDGYIQNKKKDDALAQLADSQAEIEQREQACFAQLEASLSQRSQQNLTACSAWIQKLTVSNNRSAGAASR